MSGFRPGDVVDYTPERTWCREGVAIASQYGDRDAVLLDTYWATDRHRLTDAEIATATWRFNVNDFDQLPGRSKSEWEQYAPSDRQTITSQHGLEVRRFIRKGATKDHATQVENARDRLREARSALQSAQHAVERAVRDLATVESQGTVDA